MKKPKLLTSEIQTPEVEIIKRDWEKETLVHWDMDIPPIVPTIFFRDSWMCTEGGILLVMGPRKAGKSLTITNILTTALMDDAVVNEAPEKYLHINAKKVQDGKLIVYLDTEQALQRTHAFIGRVFKKAGYSTQPDHLKFHNLRRLRAAERVQFLEEYIFPMADQIGLLIIDGLVDFFGSMNDEVEVRRFYDNLFINLPIDISLVCVIHSNNSGAAMGHLGQLFEKKAAGGINVKRNNETEVVTIECSFVRDSGYFETLEVKWDDETDSFIMLTDDQKKALKAKTLEDKINGWKSTINQIFATTLQIDKKGVQTGILNYDNTINKDVTKESLEKAIRNRLKDYIENNLLKLEDGKYSKNF